MTPEQHITIVSPTGAANCPERSDVFHSLVKDTGIQVLVIRTIPDLYPLLSDSNFHTHVIGIDIQELYSKDTVDAWNTINTLATLVDSTVCRCGPSRRPSKRDTVIVAGVDENTDVALIKDFLKINDLCVGVYPIGAAFTKEEKLEALTSFQKGNKYLPKFVQEKLKAKKAQKTSDPFKLTPRQQQIFNIIVERGSSNKVIARTLNITESTVKLHITSIFKKYGVRNRTQLAVYSRNTRPH